MNAPAFPRRGSQSSIGDVLARRYARTNQPVRRGSFDVDDKRAKVFRRIGEGTPASALSWVDKAVSAMREWDNHVKAAGKRHRLGAGPIHLYELMLTRFTDFATGRCEPSLDTLQKATSWARATLVGYLADLREAGYLGWQRRTEKTGNAPGEGPQVRQISNAYYFTTDRWPKGALRGLNDRLRRAATRARKLTDGVSSIVQAAAERAMERSGLAAWTRVTGSADPELAEQLARLAAKFDGEAASSQSGLNPPSSIRLKRSETG